MIFYAIFFLSLYIQTILFLQHVFKVNKRAIVLEVVWYTRHARQAARAEHTSLGFCMFFILSFSDTSPSGQWWVRGAGHGAARLTASFEFKLPARFDDGPGSKSFRRDIIKYGGLFPPTRSNTWHFSNLNPTMLLVYHDIYGRSLNPQIKQQNMDGSWI